MVNNQVIRDKVAEIQAKGQEDKKRWEMERASIQSKFMKELDDNADAGKKSGPKIGTDKMGNSDEDAVFVEGGGSTEGATPGGSKKKKKGKK